MAVDRSRLKARAAAGDASAKRALAVTQRTSFMLSGAQLRITVTALVVGFVAEPLIGDSLGEALGGIGLPAGGGSRGVLGHRPTAVFARVRDEIGHGFGCVFVATAAG